MQYAKNKILTEAILIKLSITERLSIPQITERLGVSQWAVKEYLHVYGIPQKRREERAKILPTILHLYFEENKGGKEIGQILNLTEHTVLNRIRAAGYKLRNKTEAAKLGWRNGNGARKIQGRPLYSRRKATNGYVLIKIGPDQQVWEHRWVWEQHHGKIPKGYIIHHLNGDKADNRIANLVCIPRNKHNSHLYVKALQERIRRLEDKLFELGGLI